MPDLTDEDIAFIRNLREKHEDGKVNRRQALGMLGAAGVGAAGGFLGTGSAAADPSTTDSDGNVGLPSDRVDVFAEGIDSNSVSANTGTIDSLDGTDMQYDSVNTDEINTTKYIEPSDGDPLVVVDDYIANNNQESYRFVLAPGDYSVNSTLEVGQNRSNVDQETPIIIEGAGGQETPGRGTYLDCSGLGSGVPAILQNATTTKSYVFLRNLVLSDTDLSSFAIECNEGVDKWEFDGVAFDGFDVQLRTHAQFIRTEFKDVFSRDGQFIHATDDVTGAAGWNVIRMEGAVFKNNASPVMDWDGITLQTAQFEGDAANCDGVFWRQSGAITTKSIRHRWHFEGMNAGAGVPLFDVGGGGRISELRMSVNESATAGGDFLRVQTNGQIDNLRIENSNLSDSMGNLLNVAGTLYNLQATNSNIETDADMSALSAATWDGVLRKNTGQTISWPKKSADRNVDEGWQWFTFGVRSAAPPNPGEGQIARSDGSGWASGTAGLHEYRGGVWTLL